MNADPNAGGISTPKDAAAELEAANAKIAELEAANAKIAELEAQLAANPTAVTSTATTPSILTTAAEPAPAAAADGQAVAVHAIAPGSAGPVVAELAAKVEQAGEKTYLTDPAAQNPTHVFTDDLLDAVRRILHNHPTIAAVADEADRQKLNRWIANLHVVTGEVWQLIQDVIDQKKAA